MRLIAFDPAYRDDMIFLVLQAKDALGCVPHLNQDLLDIGKNYLQNGGGFWLVLDKNDRVIGCGGVQIENGDGRLHRLFVKPALKRQGIGSMLLKQMERFAGDHGARRAVAHLGDPEHYWESRPFYAKHGYTEFQDRWMEKRLDVE